MQFCCEKIKNYPIRAIDVLVPFTTSGELSVQSECKFRLNAGWSDVCLNTKHLGHSAWTNVTASGCQWLLKKEQVLTPAMLSIPTTDDVTWPIHLHG